MKITLLLPWLGGLPSWYHHFRRRVNASAPLVEVKLICQEWHEMRRPIGFYTGAWPPHSIAPRKLCDYRPAFGEVWASQLQDSDWWGWCDFDCVFGDLPAFLTPERLATYDLITDHPRIVNGPFTILRNNARMRTLYREGEFEKIFTSDVHVAWDEIGFTDLVKDLKINALFLEGVHDHDRQSPSPTLRENKLYAADGRELLNYHFPRAKRWPLP